MEMDGNGWKWMEKMNEINDRKHGARHELFQIVTKMEVGIHRVSTHACPRFATIRIIRREFFNAVAWRLYHHDHASVWIVSTPIQIYVIQSFQPRRRRPNKRCHHIHATGDAHLSAMLKLLHV